MEQLGHYDPMPPNRRTTPRVDPNGLGQLTKSELMVFRSLKKNMPPDQPSSKMNSFSRLVTVTPRHKPFASSLSTRTMPRHAHLVHQLPMSHLDTGNAGSQTERAMRTTKPNYTPTVPMVQGGIFRPHPSWAPTAADRWPEASRRRAEGDFAGSTASVRRPATVDFTLDTRLKYAITKLDVLHQLNLSVSY